MADFLSAQWIAQRQVHLTGVGAVPLEGVEVVRVVIELDDAPDGAPHALTITLGAEGGRLEIGDHPVADALVRLSYLDATALHEGRLDSATALREGRVKVRGDLGHVVEALGWLVRASAPES